MNRHNNNGALLSMKWIGKIFVIEDEQTGQQADGSSSGDSIVFKKSISLYTGPGNILELA
jgi:hypothetical protein